MKTLLLAAGLVLALTASGAAHSGHGHATVDLKTAPPSHQVEAVGYCNGLYHLTFKDGSTFEFTEFNLRIKTDSSPNGPPRGAPVQVSAGMRGDRAFLVFADPAEFATFIRKTC